MMNFPDTWEEYEKLYGFNDSEEIYTNNSRLIPSFRVKQWLDHLPSVQSELYNNSTELDKENGELISRQAAIDGKICIQRSNGVEIYDDYAVPVEYLEQLPPAQLGTNLAEVGTDCISRQAAIDVINHELRCGAVIDQCGLETAHDLIEAFPSAQPERKTGKWIHKHCVWFCSECGENPTKGTGYVQGHDELYDFCPHCGSYNGGEQE